MTTTGADRDEVSFDEPIAVEKRIEQVLEELDGLPDGNAFADVVSEMRDDGASWSEIRDEIEPVFNVVSDVTFEASLDAEREWEVVTVAHEHDATTRTEVQTETVYADTAEEAEKKVERELQGGDEGMSVDQSRTTYNGVAKF
jgi:hypothetical protein